MPDPSIRSAARPDQPHRALRLSAVLAEYEEVLRRPRLKLQPQQIATAMAAIRKVAHLVKPNHTVSVSPHESDNRFLECAEAAEADWLVTGNTRHFPESHVQTKTVTGRRFSTFLLIPGTRSRGVSAGPGAHRPKVAQNSTQSS